jgi:hypothetical protein
MNLQDDGVVAHLLHRRPAVRSLVDFVGHQVKVVELEESNLVKDGARGPFAGASAYLDLGVVLVARKEDVFSALGEGRVFEQLDLDGAPGKKQEKSSSVKHRGKRLQLAWSPFRRPWAGPSCR